MSEHAVAQTQKANTPQETTKSVISLQRRPSNLPEPTIMQEWLFDTAYGTFTEPRFGYDFSRVPPHSNIVQQTMPLLRTRTMVQRFSKNGAAGSTPCATCPEAAPTQIPVSAEPAAEAASRVPESTPTTPTAEPEVESAEPGETTASGLIVEDSATDLAPGQMKKSEFLSQLRVEVCQTVEAAIAGTGRTTDDCPYIDNWLDFYSRKDSAHIERAIHRYAPEASNATTAVGYISIITQRAHQAAETWAKTGEVTGVPEGIPIGLPGTGLLGGLISGISSIFFKARDGGARAPDDPQAIQAELGEGRPLDSGVRSRMESAFGMDFSHVRAHIDTTAAGLSNRLNARAFTLGEHVAFGAGEYQPGTLVGDALIAHELAHVVQQGATSASFACMEVVNTSCDALEADADKSAVGALASLWAGTKEEVSGIARMLMPRMRSGLRLSRCDKSSKPPEHPKEKKTAPPEKTAELELPDMKCSPRPVTLAYVARIQGASTPKFGWTEFKRTKASFRPIFNSQKNLCSISNITEATFELKHFVYVQQGKPYRYGSATRTHSSCPGKNLPLYVKITPEMADKFKKGEIEHCNDLKRAFALSYGRYNRAMRAVQAEGKFPASSLGDCMKKLKTRVSSKMGIDVDDFGRVMTCLFRKSEKRDIEGWHDVNVEVASMKYADPRCTKVTHELDPKHKDMLPELGQHPSKEVVKGCGE